MEFEVRFLRLTSARQFIVVCGLAISCLSNAAFAQVMIDFAENVPSPNRLSKQYCAEPNTNMGVEFHSNPRIVAAEDTSGNTIVTASPPEMLWQSAKQEFSAGETLTISFTEGQAQIGLAVGLDRDWGFAVTARLRAFDTAAPGTGTELTPNPPPIALLGNGPSSVTTPLGFATEDGQSTIRRIELDYVGPSQGQVAIEAVDNLRFDTIGPPCAVDLAPPTVIINEPVLGQVLSSTEYLLDYAVTDDIGVATLTIDALDATGDTLQSHVAAAPGGTAFAHRYNTYAMPGMAGIRVTATDFAGNIGSDSVAFIVQLPGPDLNLWVQGMEITQAIQIDLPDAPSSRARFATEASIRSPVPLIAGKRTIVRLYPGVEDAAARVIGARVSLHCFETLGAALGSGTPCGGPLAIEPENPGAIVDPMRDNSLAALRQDAEASFNFVLPPEWTAAGRPRFLVGRIGAPPLLHECEHFTSDSCDDGANFFVYDLGPAAFQAVPQMRVLPLFYCVRRSDGVPPEVCDMVSPNAGSAAALLDRIFLDTDWDGDGVSDRFFTNTFPIADLNAGISIAAPVLGRRADGNLDTPSGILDQSAMEVLLADLCRQADLDFAASGARRYLVAFVPPPTGPSGLARLDGYCAVAKFDDAPGNNRVNDNDYCRNCTNDPVWNIHYDVINVSHELGHAFSSPHASCDHGEGNGGGCAPAPDEFPCPHGGICVGGSETREVFVFEPYLMRALPPVSSGGHAHDLMSYGPEPVWVSPRTYRLAFDRLLSDGRARRALTSEPALASTVPPLGFERFARNPAIGAAAVAAAPPAPVPAAPMLFVTGWILADGSAGLDPLIRLATHSGALDDEAYGDYALELRDGAGTVLERRVVAPVETSGEIRLFSALLPARDEAERLVLLRDHSVVAERTRSPNGPEAVLFAPAANAVWRDELETVRWQAFDTDGDELEVTVQYSADAGVTWGTIGEGRESGNLTVEAARLAAGPRQAARIRLIVSDGFSSEIVTSEPFTVLDKGPIARILGPANGTALDRTESVELAGAAEDAEDGALPPEALSWRSDRDGVLGSGHRLRQRLSPGGHFVSLTAVDSDGNVATEHLRLIVRDIVNRQPVAVAGTDTSVAVGVPVTLSAIGSYDDDDDVLSFSWRAIGGPSAAAPEPPDVTEPTVTLPIPGSYVFELTVSDGKIGSYPDQVTLFAE